MKTHKFARKPFYVDAVRVSDANREEVAQWCGGEIKTSEEGVYIHVKVVRPINPRQEQAFVGDWVLETGSGFKVYPPKSFDKSFEKVKTLTKAQADAAGIRVPHEPRPKNEQKKKPVPTAPAKKTRGPRDIGTPVLSREQAEKLKAPAEDEVTTTSTGKVIGTEGEVIAEVSEPVKTPADVEADKLISEVLRNK